MWKICNVDKLMKRAQKRRELNFEWVLRSRHSFQSYGKTWFFSFSPITGSFDFHFLEEDDNFFATFKIEIGGTVFHQEEPRKFNRGVCWPVCYNGSSGTQKNKQEEITITPNLLVENNYWKFIVTIFPCSESGEKL